MLQVAMIADYDFMGSITVVDFVCVPLLLGTIEVDSKADRNS